MTVEIRGEIAKMGGMGFKITKMGGWIMGHMFRGVVSGRKPNNLLWLDAT